MKANRFLLIVTITAALAGGAYASKRRFNDDRDSLYERTVYGIAGRMALKNSAVVDRLRASPGLARNPGELYLANWLFSLRYLKPLDVRFHDRRQTYLADESLFDTRHRAAPGVTVNSTPWSHFRGSHYDQLPRPILETILQRQMELYGPLIRPDRWDELTASSLESLPAPIRKIAAYRMVLEAAVSRSPARYGMTRGEAARLLISIGIVESLFDLDKIDNRNAKTGNTDRGYLQISDKVRHDLSRVPEFRSLKADDYFNPLVSIRAGSYYLFEKLLKRTNGDIYRAVGMYNAGPAGPEWRARGYFLAVADRYNDTFIQQDRYSPTRFLMLRYASPHYFEGVQSDHLYRFLCSTHTAANEAAPR